MTEEERIKHNKNKGYTLVYSVEGFEIYKKESEFGGWIYYTDKFSNEGMLPVFDSSFWDKEELIAIAKDCFNLEFKNNG
jgi:hypothetical protein